ncbi:hypothetical protein O181_053594 [Austropuccinia psidii MF-1]|uniref:Uncharacterized protein n=1 Tax=Austropuccinia psidii MF-1 TaxID=1389203 RepID=A0A9Q3HST4_9BASI|nr:hypothetical protein [Austropuccinia psidii MF-1]
MENARTFSRSQRLARTIYTLIESAEAEITAIPVVRSEKFPTRISRDIQVSVQELVYVGKASGVGTSSNPLNKEIELIYSSEEALRPRKNRGPSEILDSNVCQRESPADKILVEKPKHFIRG